MQKNGLIWVVLFAAIGLAGMFAWNYFAFFSATDRLESRLEEGVNEAIRGREMTRDLVAIEQQLDTLNPGASKLILQDSVMSFQAEVLGLIAVLSQHRDSLQIMADNPESGRYYWMGENEHAHNGRGNGAAFALRRALMQLSGKIEPIHLHFSKLGSPPPPSLEKMIAAQFSSDEDQSWERQYFGAGPDMALVAIDALEAELQGALRQELAWLRVWQPAPQIEVVPGQ